MKAILLVLTSVLFSTAHSIEPAPKTTLTVVTLSNGKSFTNVEVTRIEPDALTLQHAGGIARIPFEQLPEELQLQFRFDPEEAAAARKAAQERQRDRLVLQIEAELACRKAELIAEWARCYCVHVVQVIDEGILVQIHRPDGGGAPMGPPREAPHGHPENGPISSGMGERMYLLQGDTGKNLADHDVIRVFCLESEETYSYDTVPGGRRTVRVLEFVRWPGDGER